LSFSFNENRHGRRKQAATAKIERRNLTSTLESVPPGMDYATPQDCMLSRTLTVQPKKNAGLYLLSACTVATFVMAPASPVQKSLPSHAVRRMLMGLAMGATMIAIVQSPWG
jgi:hypothetical protein